MVSKKLLQVLTWIIVLIAFTAQKAYADVGSKPSITIYVNNAETQSYFLDLLVKDSSIDYNNFENHERYPEDLKNTPLFKYNEGGWMAAHLRESKLIGSITGKLDDETGLVVHNFEGDSLPSTFKVIIQKDSGEIIVSSSISPHQYNAKLMLDFKTGRLYRIPQVSFGTIYFLLLVFLTTAVKLTAAKIYNIKEYVIIIGANILTLLLQRFILNAAFDKMSYGAWHTGFLTMEFLVMLIELLIYTTFLLRYKWGHIVSFTVTTNIACFLIGLLLLV